MPTSLKALVELLRWNPRQPNTYYYAWATLALAIAVITFLAMQLWLDVVIVGVGLVICAGLTAVRTVSNLDDDRDGDS